MASFIIYIRAFHHRVSTDQPLAQTKDDLIIQNYEGGALKEIIFAKGRWNS